MNTIPKIQRLRPFLNDISCITQRGAGGPPGPGKGQEVNYEYRYLGFFYSPSFRLEERHFHFADLYNLSHIIRNPGKPDNFFPL
jgi:hypothetical protein